MSRFELKTSESMEYDSEIYEEDDRRDLENQNTSLIKENTVLKAQFESAVDVGTRVDNVYKTNEKLQLQVRELSMENEKMKRVLEISQKSYEEQILKLNKEKELLSKQHSQNNEAAKDEIMKNKQKMKKELKNAFEDNGQLCLENNMLINENKTIKAKIERLVKAFSFYLKKEITNLDELLSESENYFKTSNEAQKSPIKEVTTVKDEQNISEDVEKLKKRCRIYRSGAKEQEAKINDLKSKIESLNNEIKDKGQKESAISNLHKKIAVLEEDKKLMEEDYQHQVKLLQSKVDLLKNELSKKNSLPPAEPVILGPSYVASPQPEEVSQTRFTNIEQIEDDNTVLEEISQKSIKLTKQLKEVSEVRDNLAEKLQEVQETAEKSEAENEKLKKELCLVTEAKEKAESELEKCRSDFKDQETKNNKREKKIIKAMQAESTTKIERLQNETEVYKQQIYDNQIEIEKLNKEVSQLTKANSSLKENNTTLEKNIKKVSNEKDHLEDLLKEKPTVTEEDLLPITAWHFKGFESQLMQAVDEIGRNDVLHASSKLQKSFKVIHKFYSKKLNERHQIYEELSDDYSKMRSLFNTFAVDISIAACDTAITFEEFEAGAGKTVVESVKNIRQNQDKLMRECEALASNVALYKKAFGKEDPQQTAEKNSQMIDETNTKLRKREKCYKKAKAELQCQKEKFTKERKELNSRIEEMKEEITQLQTENDEQREQLSVTKKKLLEMTNKVREEDLRMETLELDYQTKVSEINKKAVEDKARIEAETADEIRRVTENLSVTADNFEGSQQQINQLKKVIATQRMTIAELESDRDYHKKSATTGITTTNKKYELEKQQITEKYEKIAEKTNDQIKQQQEDIERLSREIAKLEKSKKASKAQIANLIKERDSLAKELKNTEERFEREKKLIKSNANIDKAAFESKLSTKLAEAKSQMNSEKEEIFSFVCNELRENFDPKESINEHSFHNCIVKTKNELQKLQKIDRTVRKMVNASPNQTTTDAVAKIIVSY